MCCTTLTAMQATMATTQLMPALCCQVCWPREEQKAEQKPLRMNWVVVTDGDGRRRLRMCWAEDALTRC